MKTILLAEDERAVRESIARALRLENYEVTAVSNGAEAIEAFDAQHHDMLIADVMMPEIDGLTMCRRLRSRGIRTPILMITARTEISDRISGLDAGADDYLPKPFALDELLARVRALLRRASYAAEQDTSLTLGDLHMDLQARQVWRGDDEIDLTKTEFDLLELLVRNAGIVMTHSQIYDEIWKYDFGGESKALTVYIGYLRRKTEEHNEPRIIHTVRGVGYVARTK